MLPFIAHVLVVSKFQCLYNGLEIVKWTRGMLRHFVPKGGWVRIVVVSWQEYPYVCIVEGDGWV